MSLTFIPPKGFKYGGFQMPSFLRDSGLRTPGRSWFLVVLMICQAVAVGQAQSASETPAPEPLALRPYLRRVLEHNESIQVRLLELEITRRQVLAEKGIFEPELVGGPEHVENNRENTAEQRTSQLFRQNFAEQNTIYNGGIEALAPSGARVRLGYTLRRLDNTLQGGGTNSPEYQTFAGFSLTQPLLRNGGWNATIAGIRLAAMASEVAFQEYRRQLMVTVSAAEASYWNLYLAQQQLLFFRESVELAETILSDNKARLDAGRGTELEVLEAEAGLALRRSKQSEVLQKYYEAGNRLITFYSGSVLSTNSLVIAIDEPLERDVAMSYFEGWQLAFESNPDYLSQRKRAITEGVRVAYAKNQRWPQLDLKASYGLNGLSTESPSRSWDDIEHGGFPSWSVGVELRLPLAGGIKSRHELGAARIRQKQALLSLKEIETQIANALQTAIQKIISLRDSVAGYTSAVTFNQNLLDTELERLKVGRVESRKVLEVEADLFEARSALAEAMVLYQRALLELELIQGAVLKSRNLELTQDELEAKTALLIRRGDITDERYERFLADVRSAYDVKSGMTASDERKALEILHQQSDEMDRQRTRGTP